MISVWETSRIWKDMLHQTLTESTLSKHFSHKNFLRRYPSNNHIQRHVKRTKKDSGKTPVKHTKIFRQPFHWNRQCLFCGEECLIEVDKKKPLSFRESHLSAKHLIGVKESCPSRRWFCRWGEVSLPECLYYDWYLTRTKRVVSFCKHVFIKVLATLRE